MKWVPLDTDLFYVIVASAVMRYVTGTDSRMTVQKYSIFEASVC
jgi:hypothetical protein